MPIDKKTSNCIFMTLFASCFIMLAAAVHTLPIAAVPHTLIYLHALQVVAGSGGSQQGAG